VAEKIKLKNLEGGILGAIASQEPCTAYRVHKEFSNSPSLYFSGSAGSVYPAFRRLEARGLIKAKSVGTQLRPAKGYVLTKAGREVFQAWYLSPALAADGGFDPLRLRFSMIESQPPETRAGVLGDLISAATKRIQKVKKMLAALPETSAPYFAAQLELAALQAKVKVMQTWKKNGPDLKRVERGSSVLFQEK